MVARFDTHEAMLNGVKAGLGWAAVPSCIKKRYCNSPGLLWFDVDTDPMLYPVDIVLLADHAISPLAQEFIEFIKTNIPKGYFQA